MPIRRSPNGVLNAVHRLGRLPGTVGLHPVGTVGRHASERQVVMTWCAQSLHHVQEAVGRLLCEVSEKSREAMMAASPNNGDRS